MKKLHVKYFRNGDRYDDGVNVSQIGNRSWAIDWHHHLWPWMTLSSPSSRSSKLHFKYFKNGDRYDEVNISRIGYHPWAINGHHDLWLWMTLNSPSPRSSKLHVKYFRNGDRYDDGVNVSPIGNRSWAIDWHHHLWPWMTLSSPSLRSSKLTVGGVVPKRRSIMGIRGCKISLSVILQMAICQKWSNFVIHIFAPPNAAPPQCRPRRMPSFAPSRRHCSRSPTWI